MRTLFVHSVRLLFACIVLYAVLILISLAIFPLPAKQHAFDTASAPRTVFETQQKYLVLNREALRAEGTRVVFLGASNTVAGFPVPLVQSQLPDASINSAALNGSNITQIHEAFELTRNAIEPRSRPQTIYVIGLWYGLFADDAVRWPHAPNAPMETSVDTEMYRYGLYRKTAAGPEPVVPERLIPAARIAIYPVITLEKLVRAATGPMRERFLGAHPTDRTDGDRNAYVATATDMKTEMDYWIQSFPDRRLSARQFDELRAMVDEARADGSPVVIANLPIPAWHSATMHYDADYAARIDAFVASYRNDPLVASIDMRDMNDDTWFTDEVHPKPKIVPLWIRRISEPLNRFVARVDRPGRAS